MAEQAKIEPTTRISKVWFIPFITFLIGAWMVYYQWSNQGPEITIKMESAAGLEANKTAIKVRDLDIGKVTKIELDPDLNGVIVTARLDASAEDLLTTKTRFWLVSPRVSFTEVSGLNTLLSGSYIAMSPEQGGEEAYEFIAETRPPVTPPGTPGLHLKLNSNDEFAYKAGDPIIYKGFKVGEFEDANFNIEERTVYYQAFIEAPYHKLITQNTRFWNTSGVRFHLASSGIKVETGSLETLLANGVTFGIPEGVPQGQLVTENAFFKIFSDQKSAFDARFKLSVEFLLFIEDSVRGLTVGAPVEYRGLQIGEVIAINQLSDVPGNILEQGYPIPVLINIYPGKVGQQDNQSGVRFVRERMRAWLSRDLRATLKMGNVLTGGLYVDLQHHKDVEPMAVATIFDHDVIPVVSNEFTLLTQKAEAILDKINDLPVEDLITDVTEVIDTLGQAADSVTQTSQNFDTLVGSMDGQSINTNVNQVLEDLSAVLQNFSQGGLSPAEIQETMDDLQETLRNIQPLLLQLNQTPNSLIFSDNSEVSVEPKAKQPGAFDEE